jgi:hypothetical protein
LQRQREVLWLLARPLLLLLVLLCLASCCCSCLHPRQSVGSRPGLAHSLSGCRLLLLMMMLPELLGLFQQQQQQ